MSHKKYKDSLALEALHSLDEAEASLLREHLATCDECQRELIEWRDAAALLARSVDPIPPPETLRAGILDSLKEINPFSHRARNGETNANSETHRNRETGKVLPLRSKSNAGGEKAFFGKSALWTGALAASLVVAALLISLVVFWQRNNARQEEQARLSNSGNEKQTQLNQSLPRKDETPTETAPASNNDSEAPAEINRLPNRNDNNNRQDKKTEQRKVIAPTANQPQPTEAPITEPTITAPSITVPPITEPPLTVPAPSVADTQVVELSGTAKAPQAHARLVFDKNAGNITVSVSELPPPAAGKAYQLWFIVKGHPVPGTVFVTGREGRAMIHGEIPVRARGASAFAITLEGSTGANKPSGDKYLLGSITAS